MKVEQPDMRRVMWDCPWAGHAYGEGGVMVRNSTRPDVVGMQCVKCGALIYEQVKVPVPSPLPVPIGLVDRSGAPLELSAADGFGCAVDATGAPVLVTAAREDGN